MTDDHRHDLRVDEDPGDAREGLLAPGASPGPVPWGVTSGLLLQPPVRRTGRPTTGLRGIRTT